MIRSKRRKLVDDEVIRTPRAAKVIAASRERLEQDHSNTDLLAMASRLTEITTTWKNPIQEQFDMLEDVLAVIKDRNITV